MSLKTESTFDSERCKGLKPINYSLYLVTDSGLNYPSRTLAQSVEDAILGGATIVQIREKHRSTEDYIQIAKEIHEVTRRHGIPLIINDNIDVLLATDAEGLHVGQDDMACCEVRKRIGPHKIVGVSVENPDHARKAIEDGADYVGIQICYPTDTKKINKPFLGHIGVREILESMPVNLPAKTVAIGGIRENNIQRLIRASVGSNGRMLDGIAVVSAIIGAQSAKAASTKLLEHVQSGRAQRKIRGFPNVSEVVASVPEMLSILRQICPLTLHISNFVVMNDTANCTLALGGSPIMSCDADEAKDLSKVISSLVLNIGTLNETFVSYMVKAGSFANVQCKPVVFDPVGAGTTRLRREATRKILNAVHVDILKGNPGEISTVADMLGCGDDSGPMIKMRGVDSVHGDMCNAADLVKAIAKREECIAVMTGEIDYVSDGNRTVRIQNGHTYQSQITGSGCMATAIIGAFAGISEDHFAAAVAGLLFINVAGERAGRRNDVRGPGTFRSAFMDEISNLVPTQDILREFKVEEL